MAGLEDLNLDDLENELNNINLGIEDNKLEEVEKPKKISKELQEELDMINRVELGEVVESPVQVEIPSQPVIVQTPKMTSTSSQATPNLSIFDKDNEDDLVFVNIGESVDESRVPYLMVKPGETTRVMIFTDKMITVYTHFIEGLGNIRCKSIRDAEGRVIEKAPCCKFINEEDGKERWALPRKIMPVIEYPVSGDGKSVIADRKPMLKFVVISRADMKSLNAIMIDDETKKSAMKNDFYIKVDANDKYKTKVFSSTFDTIRAKFAEEVKAEISKVMDLKTGEINRELFKQAREDKFRDVPVETIQRFLEESDAKRIAAHNAASVNTSVPSLDSLLG